MFKDSPAIITQLFDLLGDYTCKRLSGTSDSCSHDLRVSEYGVRLLIDELFHGHDDLILEFNNAFLPVRSDF